MTESTVALPPDGDPERSLRMTSPTEYRAFLLDKNDHIVRRFDFEADNHDAALNHAKQYVDGHDVEVWHGTYVLGRLKHDK